MKMMLAQCCGTIVVPHHHNRVVRWCDCGESACWWENGDTGQFALYNRTGNRDIVSGIGLHNGFLTEKLPTLGTVPRDRIQEIIKATPSSYLFKQVESLVIKFRPGFTSDVRFVSAPEDIPDTWELRHLQVNSTPDKL